ncbi:MAG: hypothetical protein EOM24_05095 [Chloroflexia bacterium]|nr:hypothetical protein [Chloroflexia bacterium]
MSNHEIGGYFGLELGVGHNYPHAEALHLNSARNAFLHILESVRPSRVLIPSYLCKSMTAPLISTGIPHDFYHIDERLEIVDPPEVADNELILYVNYFGVKTRYSEGLAKRYSRSLVLDNSQAFLSPPTPGIACVYSPRKFVGVSDGGLLYGASSPEVELEHDSSVDSTRHLIGRLDANAAEFYADYRRSEASLGGRPLRAMSKFTRVMLQSLDYEQIKQARERNFWYLHAHLASSNQLRIVPSEVSGPMVYPFWSRQPDLRERLIENHIYVARYWAEVLSNPHCSAVDERLTNELLPLPVDQRDTAVDMDRIIETILDD